MIVIKKVMLFIVLVVSVSFLMLGYSYSKTEQPPPKLMVSVEDNPLDYIVVKNVWNGKKYDRENTLQTILKKCFKNDIPYVEIGREIKISFLDNPPSEITISAILIDENGNQKYDDRAIVKIPVLLKDGKCSFEVEKHMASLASSFYVRGGTNIQCFRMTASWGKNKCEYAFMIRTDA